MSALRPCLQTWPVKPGLMLPQGWTGWFLNNFGTGPADSRIFKYAKPEAGNALRACNGVALVNGSYGVQTGAERAGTGTDATDCLCGVSSCDGCDSGTSAAAAHGVRTERPAIYSVIWYGAD